jgi:hypothetical protein
MLSEVASQTESKIIEDYHIQEKWSLVQPKLMVYLYVNIYLNKIQLDVLPRCFILDRNR